MTAIRQWVGDFDLGRFLGIGLDTAQIGYLAGALFLALFGLSAVRRASRAGGVFPAAWFTVAVGLLAGALLTAARGFPEEVPDDLKPWTEPDRLLRAAAILALLGFSTVLLSAHWVRRRSWRMTVRTLGLAVTGVAIWLAAGWFGDQLPDEARPWAARAVVTRLLAVVGLIFLATVFWFRPAGEPPHRRWAARTLAAPIVTLAIVFGLRWFGRSVWDDVPIAEMTQVTVVLAAIATGTCGLIAGGAYFLRDRPRHRQIVRRSSAESSPIPLSTTDRPLPVAILLDDNGRPQLPVPPPHAGSPGT